MKCLGTDEINSFRNVFAWLIVLAEFFPLFTSGPSKSSSKWISVDPRSFSALAFLPPFPLVEPEVRTEEPERTKLSFFWSLMANTRKWWGHLPEVGFWLIYHASMREGFVLCFFSQIQEICQSGFLSFPDGVCLGLCGMLFLFYILRSRSFLEDF